MMVTGAQADFDFEDRADAVRRALGGLAGTKKTAFGFGNASHKPTPVVSTPASLPLQTPVPRILLSNQTNSSIAVLQNSMAAKFNAQTNVDTTKTETKPVELYTHVSQPGAATVSKANGTTTVKDAQELLCQLRLTEKLPIRGLEGENVTAVPEVAVPTQPLQRQGQAARQRKDCLVGRNGKKKTDIEKENDRLLDELDALGEPIKEIPGETPVEENQRLRREATVAMLKHSFFIRRRQTPPASTASGDFSNRESSRNF
jgi:hypothetical protein